MATLLTVGNSEGDRRCDAKCYEAKDEKCTCVCGGRNHGKGYAQAWENTRQMAVAMVDRIIDNQGELPHLVQMRMAFADVAGPGGEVRHE